MARQKADSRRPGDAVSHTSCEVCAGQAAGNLHPALLCAVLVALVYFTFLPALNNDFVSYDDGLYVTANPHVQAGLTLETVRWAFKSSVASNWHPLTWLSHALDCQLFGLKPRGHHLTSVLIHCANTLLLFLLLTRMTGARWRSFFVAALFGVHPLHVESVAWIAERKDVLSTFFFFATIWAYVRWVEDLDPESRGNRVGRAEARTTNSLRTRARSAGFSLSGRFFLALFLFTLGLLSKPMVVTIPFVLLLLDIWPLRRLGWPAAPHDSTASASTSAEPSRLSIQTLLLEKSAFFLLAFASCVVTYQFQRAGGSTGMILNLSTWDRLGNAVVAIARYLQNAVWPANLAVFYPHPGHWPALTVILCLGLVIAISGISVVRLRDSPWLLVGWLWFLGTLTPVIGLVQVGRQSMADRYTYIPLVGIFIAVCWELEAICVAIFNLSDRLKPGQHAAGSAGFSRSSNIAPKLIGIFGAATLLAFSGLTLAQVRTWKSTETLFTHAAAVTRNNFVAYGNLAAEYERQRRTDAALRQYDAFLQIRPDDVVTRNAMGSMLLRLGRTDEAIRCFREALQRSPGFAEARNNLGFALQDKGLLQEAEEQFQAAAQSKPGDARVRINLGGILLRQGKIVEAIGQWQEALRLDPRDVVARTALANALFNSGRAAEAIEHYRLAVEFGPKDAEARRGYATALQRTGKLQESARQFAELIKLAQADAEAFNNLGFILQGLGQTDQARSMFEQALKFKPDFEPAHNNLGVSLQSAGRLDEAIREFQSAVRLNPASPEDHFNLGMALAGKGDRSGAIEHLNQAIRLRPNYQEAQEKLQTLTRHGP